MKFLTSMIVGLHYTIGIRPPPAEQMRKIAIVWILSVVVILATLILLLVYVF
jgi:hypothetical protein